MKFPSIYLTYIYSAKDIDNPNRFHQVEISSFFETNEIMKKEDLILILEKDGAYFYKDSIRYFNMEKKSFFKLPEDFQYDINVEEFDYVFLIKNRNATIKKARFDYLEKEVQLLKIKLQEMADLLKNIEDPMYLSRSISAPTTVAPNLPKYIPKKKKHVDITIMYSAPLIRRKERTNIPTQLSDPVDFEAEINALRRMFQEENYKIKLKVEIATVNNLSNVISKQPTILHFICHGDYSKKKQRVYLAFENDCGELDKCYADRIQKLLSKSNIDIKIVFVNACHSEEVGKVFLEAGIPCVIAVQSELKIEDGVAKKFSENFYRAIFSGETIRDAFDKATTQVQAIYGTHVYTCCCAHSHTSNCQWYVLALDDDFAKAHNAHTPTCNCENAKELKHLSSCTWANDFAAQIGLDDEVNEEDNQFFVCCCRKKENFPHNETLKFRLMFKNKEDYGNFKIFEDMSKGTLEEINKIEPCFSYVKIFGRNTLINRLFNLIKNKSVRIVQVSGESGVGKTDFVKQSANYIHERGIYSDEIKYENLEGVNSILTVIARIKGDFPTEQKFYEFYKMKKLIFILDNCDYLINVCGGTLKLSSYLKKIIDNTHYVKFILITLSVQKFNIGESNILLGPLEPLDAAKFFIFHVESISQTKYRDPINLANHDVINLVRRTPKNLLLLVQKYEVNHYLDELALELKYGSLKVLNSNDISIEKSLRDLESKCKEAYDFLIFLANFPAGLLFEDLQTLSKLEYIPKNWLNLLKMLTVDSKNFCRNSETEDKLSKSIQIVQTIKRSSVDPDANGETSMSQQIPPSDYIWIKVEKMNKGKMFLKVEHFLVRFIKECNTIRNFDLEIKAIDFISHLSKIMIKQIKKEMSYFERIVECSPISEEGIWSTDKKKNEEEVIEQIRPRNINRTNTNMMEENQNYSSTTILEIHKTNFYHALNPIDASSILRAKRSDSNQIEKFMKSIETLCESVPAIFKIVGNWAEALELANDASSLCSILKQNGESSPLAKLEIKISLMKASLYYHDIYDIDKFKLLKQTLSNIPNLYNQLYLDDEMTSIVNEEIRLIEISSELKLKKRRKENLELIKDAKKKFAEEHWIQHYPILYNKFIILEGESLWLQDPENFSFSENFYQTLQNCCNFFRDKQLLYFQLLTNKLLSKYIIRAAQDPKISENLLNDILNKAKNVFCQTALDLSIKIKDKTEELECKELLDQIHEKIRKVSSHIFIFMRSCPLVLDEVLEGKKNKICHLGFRFYIPSTFRKDLKRAVESTNTEISLKFETLNKGNLIDTLEKGCQIFQLNIEYDEQNFILENEYGAADKMPLSELQKLLENMSNFIEILIICCRKGLNIASIFANIPKLQIKHIIYFDFKRPETNKNFINFLQDICMNEFSIQFVSNICERNTIEASFKKAEDAMTQKIVSDFCYFLHSGANFKDLLGEGPMIFPRPYQNKSFKFTEGKFKDISNVKAPSNLEKPGNFWIRGKIEMKKSDFKINQNLIIDSKIKASFNSDEPNDFLIGRKTDIYEIMKIITQEKKCVNIYGKKGIGKTTFSKLLGYYVYSRSLFKHGVFYFSFKNLKKNNNDMKELMKEELGEDFSKHIHVYFENKSILLIFDDFDAIKNSGNEIRFKQHIFDSLEKEKIIYIIISRENLMMEGVESHKLGFLSLEDSNELLDFKFSEYSARFKDFNKQKSWKEKRLKILKENNFNPQKMIGILKEINLRKRNISSPAPPKKMLPLKKDNSTRDFKTLKKRSKDGDSSYFSPPMTHTMSQDRMRFPEYEREESKDRSSDFSKFDVEENNSSNSGTHNNISLDEKEEEKEENIIESGLLSKISSDGEDNGSDLSDQKNNSSKNSKNSEEKQLKKSKSGKQASKYRKKRK